MIFSMINHRVAKIFSLKNKAWSYRGEGNANLVLSLIDDRKIIRLRKSLPHEEIEDQIWLERDFYCKVMQPLLGEHFVDLPTVVRLPETEVVELNENLLSFRPVHRHAKGLYVNYATIFPDLCLLPLSVSSVLVPTFCVEVKPKQGWIPFPERRLSKCTFCLNQYLKLRKGLVKKKSQYCPLDLFSGNRSRMKCAMSALLHNPQNNLKLFKNGNLVYGDSTAENFETVLEDWFGFSGIDKLVDNFTSLIVDALVADFSESDTRSYFWDTALALEEANRAEHKSASPRIPQKLLDEVQALLPGPSCYKDMENLPKNCILSRILRLQKLDLLEFDKIYYLYHSLSHNDDFSYVYDLLLSSQNIFKPVNSYLLSTTAKDCSILIAFQKRPTTTTLDACCIKDSNNTYYSFNIGLSDLDPKPASCIEKHRKRDYDVVINCIDILRSQK